MSTGNNTSIVEETDIPEGWGWSTLGDVSEKPQYGWTTKANHSDGELKLLRTTDITSGSVDWSSVPYCTEAPEDIEKYLVESGDILISRAGSVGVSFLINKPERAVFASYLIRFRPKSDIDTKYFYYYLKSPAYWEAIGASKSGIAVPNVNASKLAQVPIPIAPPERQKGIVAEIEKQFSRLDEAVANLQRVKANLKRYKAAVLKAAVEGRLVETEAELARREGRSYETGAQLLQRILETRRSQWQGKGKYKEPVAPNATDLPGLPDGWVWASVDQLLMSLRNGLSKKPEDSQPGIPILRISAVRPLELDTMDRRFYRPQSNEHVDDYKLEEGDVLFVRYNGTKELVGVCALVNMVPGAILYPDKLIRGRVVSEQQVLPSYLAIAANVGESRQHIDELIKTTAGQQGIAGGEIKKMPIPLPPYSEQHRIVSEVDRRLTLLRETEAQVHANLRRSEGLRNSVLARAFSIGVGL